MKSTSFYDIAHVRKSDGAEQRLFDHLIGTSTIAKSLASKIGLPLAGEWMGLVHDLGKYSQAFQGYIRANVAYERGKGLNLDEDEEAVLLTNGKPKRGSVDHSTAGAMYLFEQFKDLTRSISDKKTGKKVKREEGKLFADFLFICVASHHSGMINVVDNEGHSYLCVRQGKAEVSSHYQESLAEATDNHLFAHLDADFVKSALKEFIDAVAPILSDKALQNKQRDFFLGFYARLLFSCLIDADRSNSIAFEYPSQAQQLEYHRPEWQIAIDKLEAVYDAFADKTKRDPPNLINDQRNHVANMCYEAGQKAQGIYTLTVPTGGGKTLASLRFALQHAKRHNLDRIFFIIPFTSIIEQNAQEIRQILEERCGDGSYVGDWVLEQHSNLEPDVQTWQSKLIMDNWNAPIVFTTMVQFLESCFGGGTKGVRRLHQLSRAVLIFDEIQTLPINCYYLFCNAINFLTSYVHSTAVLCTATQPVLNNLPIEQNGSLNSATEIVGKREYLSELFDTLKRVEIHNHSQLPKGLDSLTDYIADNFKAYHSTLVIVNTKIWASQLYRTLLDTVSAEELFHLSTGQCARHRKDLLRQIKERLKQGLPTLVVSTQLIEAGVDVSFKSVIRFLAGLDSIAQAAGRCNRHGEMVDNDGLPLKGQVFIVKPDKESLNKLPTIKLGKEQMENEILPLFSQAKNNDKDLLDPAIMTTFFEVFYMSDFAKHQMAYPIKNKNGKSSGSDSIFTWLSNNSLNSAVDNDNPERVKKEQFPKLWQSFMDAGRAFKAIDAPTQALIVPYGVEGRELITDLCGTEYSDKNFYKLVREAQQYSINIFRHAFEELQKEEAIHQIRDTGIFTLEERFYDEKMGLDRGGSGKLDFIGFGNE